VKRAWAEKIVNDVCKSGRSAPISTVAIGDVRQVESRRPITRELLANASPSWVHRGRRILQPDVSAYEIGDRRFVVKDFARRPWIVRRFWGRWILRREWDRLERLQDLDGVPRLLGWVDGDAFAMEWLDAERLPHLRENRLDPVFFERLEKLVEAMHERGISHGDLRRKNILVDADQRPYLVDFATAFRVGRRRRGRRFFERLCEIDRLTVLKLKSYYFPDSLSDEERRLLDRQPLALKIGRFLRKKVYRPLKPRRIRRSGERLREFLLGGRKGGS